MSCQEKKSHKKASINEAVMCKQAGQRWNRDFQPALTFRIRTLDSTNKDRLEVIFLQRLLGG